MRTLIAIFIFMIGSTAEAVAQPNHIDSVKAAMLKMNNRFDSARYLAFNVDLQYSTDTAYGLFEHEEIQGTYVLNRSNLYYKMGQVEYAQTDSFIFNIYNDDKMMVMMQNDGMANSGQFPIRDFLDSSLAYYDSMYTISVYPDTAGLKVIRFTGIHDTLPYTSFSIAYDSVTYYPYLLTMTSKLLSNPEAGSQKIVPRNSVITMRFSGYRYVPTLDVLQWKRYVHRTGRKYVPSDTYSGYELIASMGDDESEQQFDDVRP